MAAKDISFKFNYKYEMEGVIGPRTKTVWIVFHGYGQLAKYFINNFDPLYDDSTCIIAPQGLSRFYLTGFSGRTGATWMCTEGREEDIENYLTYIDAIYQQEIAPHKQHIKLGIIGFSQGASTATRWIMNKEIQYEKLVLWGGFFAHEIDRSKVKKYFSGDNIHLVYGLDDPFVGPEVEKNIQRKIKKLCLSPNVITFNGKHEIDRNTLLRLKESFRGSNLD